MNKIRIVAGKEQEPEWMKGKFSDYWDMWQNKQIKMCDFCDLIDKLDDVPQEVKDNWRRDLMNMIGDINKAIFIYNQLDDKYIDRMLDYCGYDPSVRYTINY